MTLLSPISHFPTAVAVCFIAVTTLFAGDVVVNEIHYEAADKTLREEFVELLNCGETSVDVSGWFFSSGISYTFPDGTVIPPGGYLVVAEDPGALVVTEGAVDPLGPWEGRLANEGERVVLRNSRGEIEDEVTYRSRFPWPSAPSGAGSSMELIGPQLDNDLGGSWRASGFLDTVPEERVPFLGAEASDWHYRKGTSEASDPVSAWRELDFVEDDTWLVGKTSIGFGDDDDNTVLEDMHRNYSSLYLRHKFTVPA